MIERSALSIFPKSHTYEKNGIDKGAVYSLKELAFDFEKKLLPKNDNSDFVLAACLCGARLG